MVSTRGQKNKQKEDANRDGAPDAAVTTSTPTKAAGPSKVLTPIKSPLLGVLTRLKSKKRRQLSSDEQLEEKSDDTRLDSVTRVAPSDNDESMEAILSPKMANDKDDINSEEVIEVTAYEDCEAKETNVSRKLDVIYESAAEEAGAEGERGVEAKRMLLPKVHFMFYNYFLRGVIGEKTWKLRIEDESKELATIAAEAYANLQLNNNYFAWLYKYMYAHPTSRCVRSGGVVL